MIFAIVYFSFHSIFASNSDFFEYTQESHVFEKAGTGESGGYILYISISPCPGPRICILNRLKISPLSNKI